VKGTALPVVTNLYGSRRRLCELIGAADGRFCRRWTELMRATPAPATRAVEPGERIEGRLGDLPLVTYCERDAAPYITAGVFLASEPETGVPNLSFHRAMHVSDTELRVRLGGSHDLTRYQAKAEAAGQALEAAILIGAPPEVVLAAAASIPYEESDDVYWAFLTRGRADQRAFVLPDVPGFYRDPNKDHYGRLAIDATMPFARRAEFERKRIPGADRLDLRDYFG
jgi:4-hydroxybenzoate decarboxylase